MALFPPELAPYTGRSRQARQNDRWWQLGTARRCEHLAKLHRKLHSSQETMCRECSKLSDRTGRPYPIRTGDQRIKSRSLCWDRSLNQALAAHAQSQEQRYAAWNEGREGKKSYEMATLAWPRAALVPLRRRRLTAVRLFGNEALFSRRSVRRVQAW